MNRLITTDSSEKTKIQAENMLHLVPYESAPQTQTHTAATTVLYDVDSKHSYGVKFVRLTQKFRTAILFTTINRPILNNSTQTSWEHLLFIFMEN
jgi:hypothetical protein